MKKPVLVIAILSAVIVAAIGLAVKHYGMISRISTLRQARAPLRSKPEAKPPPKPEETPAVSVNTASGEPGKERLEDAFDALVPTERGGPIKLPDPEPDPPPRGGNEPPKPKAPPSMVGASSGAFSNIVVPTGLQSQSPLAQPSASEPATPSIRYKAGRYFFHNTQIARPPQPGEASPPPQQPDASAQPGSGGAGAELNPETTIPPGEWLEAALMQWAFSENEKVPVVAGLMQPMRWHGRDMLTPPVKFLGTVTGKMRDRLHVTYDRAVLPSGQVLHLKGIAEDTRGLEGIPGVRIDKGGGSKIMAALTASMANMGSMAGMLPMYGMMPMMYGGMGSGSTGGMSSMTEMMPMMGMMAGMSASGAINQLLAQRLEEYGPYVTCPWGTRHRIYLPDALDVSEADYPNGAGASK
ncbi:hypothetical protein [Verrucomicrobium sp. 3C]|uniref:hypothetical protein n=1 Tax=Verrucomicrobium sp. 3C TaxID=1134055 RepID=UPI0003A4C02B|nr:hypothetical protein [Verrucomicrobium sp. 3C]